MVNRCFTQQALRPVQGTIRITLYVIYITGFIGPSSSGRNIYSSCKSSKPFKLNVHVVPHTHNDVGWVRTVDQYYYGKEFPKGVFKGGVQHILNSVIEELLRNKERKFTYVETAFFWKWYIRQSVWRRSEVRMLVQQGRLQFAGGAWTMNDEASTHYQCIIDQFTYGIKKLNYTFGAWAIPTAGWQIDPFGHSREFASLLAAMGFDGLFLGRIDYEDKSMRHERKSLEMIWRGDDDLGNRSDIFTSVLYNLYQPPPSFCYTEKCKTPESQQVEDFIRWVFEQAQHYVTNHVLVTMGDDFAYKDAGVWYRNMDKLIENANQKSYKDGLDLNVFYSTPSCYLKAVKDIMPTLPTKQDDFFPYASEPNAYWTGFYTSRPTLKYFVKQGNTIFQMARQLQVLVDLDEENQLILDSLAAALGVLQHHDAITGTSKQHVVNDYIRTLHRAIDKSLLIFNQAYYKLSGSYGTEKDLKFEMCALNESRCDVSENTHQFVVMVFNPLPWQRIHVLRVPVGNHAFFTVRNPSGVVIKSEMQEIFKGFQKNTDRVMVAEYELVFAVKLQATGYKAYYVTENSRQKRFSPLANKGHLVDSLGYTIHSRHGYVEQHGVKFYSAYGKTDHRHQHVRGRPSGAYIFHPKSSQTTYLKLQQSFGRRNFISTEQLNILDHNFAYILRSNKKEFLPFDEMEWQIGPINVNDYTGKEFVITHKLNINNKGIFYTDSNGRQMIQRHVNKRVQWNATITNVISGNYYPITNEIAIENNDVRYIVLTDRACGATSLNPGEIEIMIHRRLLHDDGLGVDEALNEVESELGIVVRGTHKFLLVPTKYKSVGDAVAVRRVEIESQYDPIVLFADAADIEYDEWMKMKNVYSGIKTLDIGISILTIAPWRDGLLLLRLENILSKETGLPEKDLIRTVHITKLFKDIQVISVRETLLAANGWVADYDRWEWKTQNRFNNSFEESFQSKKDKPESILYNVTSKTAHAIIVNLRPKQIRTFIVKYRFLDYL